MDKDFFIKGIWIHELKNTNTEVIMNHYEKIDPIGESQTNDPQDLTSTEKLQEDIINRNAYVDILKKEVSNLDEIIKGHSTYSDDVHVREKLKNLSQRIKNALKGLDSANNEIDGFIESNFKD